MNCFSNLGFSDRWANWIIQRITTATFRVVMNGKTGSLIYPERGIRQCDTISPYILLFALITLDDTFILLRVKPIEIGIKLNKDYSNISYLMFTDYCLIFCRAT